MSTFRKAVRISTSHDFHWRRSFSLKRTNGHFAAAVAAPQRWPHSGDLFSSDSALVSKQHVNGFRVPFPSPEDGELRSAWMVVEWLAVD